MDKPQVHVTDVHQFMTCRTKWFYSSQLAHGLTSIAPNKHLLLGTAVHFALGAYYGAGPFLPDWDGAGALIAYDAHIARLRLNGLEADEFIEEYIQLGREMIVNYIPWSHKNDRFVVVMPEVELRYDFGKFLFVGTADGIVKDEQGGLWLLEHKTAAQFPNSTALSFSLQTAMYCWVAQKMKTISSLGKVKGVIFNILRKAVPTLPKMLKSGNGFERRKDQGCTPDQYMQAVIMAGLDTRDYAEFAATLDPYKFVHREYISLPMVSLVPAVAEFKMVANEMLAAKPKIYRCDPLRQCSWCMYRSLCAQKLFGRAWEDIAAYEFVREERLVDEQDTD
jgi:hypothetical protein